MSKHSAETERLYQRTRTERELALWGAYCAIRHELAGDTMRAEMMGQLLVQSTILGRPPDNEERERVLALLG